jgi:transposase-like protein
MASAKKRKPAKKAQPKRPAKKQPVQAVRKPQRGKQPLHEVATMAEALRASGGLLREAARQLKISHHTLRKWINRTPELQKVWDEIREQTVWLAESAMIEIVNDPKHRDRAKVAMFLAKTLGAKKGYVERVQLTGAPADDKTAAPIQATLSFYLPEIAKD